MRKRILCLLLAGCLLLGSVCVLFSCGSKGDGNYTRMTVEINPGVELMLDGKNNVVAATGLNDEGDVLIAGEELAGKSAENAVELFVTLAVDTGYLLRGSAELGGHTVRISVSGDAKAADKLWSRAKESAKGVLDARGITAAVERAEALTLDALRGLVVSDGLFTEDEAEDMDEKQLYRALAAGRVETALLLTDALRETYFAAKAHRISFAGHEETLKLMDSLRPEVGTNLYSVIYLSYEEALTEYREAIDALDDMRYRLLVAPDSDYQKSLEALRNAKEELLKQRVYTASLEVNGTEYASAKLTLQLKEETYNSLLHAYEQLGERTNAALLGLIGTMNGGLIKLNSLKSTLADKEELRQAVKEHAKETENNLNAIKDGFFAEFEKQHADDIQAVREALVARKARLIEQAKTSA